MSQFNRKGQTTIRVKEANGSIRTYAVPKGSALDNISKHHTNKALRERKKAQREYKKQLKELKKKVPLAERSQMRWIA